MLSEEGHIYRPLSVAITKIKAGEAANKNNFIILYFGLYISLMFYVKIIHLVLLHLFFNCVELGKNIFKCSMLLIIIIIIILLTETSTTSTVCFQM